MQRSFKFASIVAIAVALVLLFTIQLRKTGDSGSSDSLSLPSFQLNGWGSKSNDESKQQPKRKYAYATFFSSPANSTNDDKYFTAARVLAYQILHHPLTKSSHQYPLLILVTSHVDDWKKQVLAKEGATIVETDALILDADWVRPGRESYFEQYTKLRLFQLTEYERILFIDSDMLLLRNLDDIFDEEIVQQELPTQKDYIKLDEAPLPETYLFVGNADANSAHNDGLPVEGYELNGGFWMMRPDKMLYDYYMSVLKIEGRVQTSMMEQDLLNYAFRPDGPMPHARFPFAKWNINWPSYGDVQRGIATVHDKFWDPENLSWIERPLVEMWWRMQGQMEGYWQRAREDGLYQVSGRAK